MIYKFFEKWNEKDGFQSPEIKFENRFEAEKYFKSRKEELSKTCYSIGKSTLVICCIEISEKTGNFLSLLYDHYLYGLIWIDLFIPTREERA